MGRWELEVFYGFLLWVSKGFAKGFPDFPVFFQNRTLWECIFFNVFKLANVANAELHIPVSAVHPSLAMHISLFCLLQGYQKHQKKWRIHVRYQNIAKTLKNQKKQKKTKRENLCISKTSKKQKKQKNQKGQNLCKTKKPKKTKWQNLCPSVWHGVNTLFFFVFLVFRGKTQKKQNGRTYVPVSGMGSVLLFFFVFWFFELKPKNPPKKWQNLCPSVWHGVGTFVFFPKQWLH